MCVYTRTYTYIYILCIHIQLETRSAIYILYTIRTHIYIICIYMCIYIYYHQPVLQQSCHAALGRCDEHRCFLWRLLDNGRCFRDDLVRRFMPFLHMSRHKASCSCTCPCTCMHACIMHAIQATAWQSGWGGFSGAWDVCCCKTWSYIQFMNAHACCYTHSQAPHDTLQQGEFPVPKTKCCCQKSYLYVIRIQGTASHTGCSGVSGSLEAGMIATFWRCRVDVSLLPQHRRGQLRVIAEVNLKSSCNMATVCDLVNVCMPCHVFWHPTWHCWVHCALFHCKIFFHNLIFRYGLLLGILIQVNWLIVTVPLWIFKSSSLLCRYRKPQRHHYRSQTSISRAMATSDEVIKHCQHAAHAPCLSINERTWSQEPHACMHWQNTYANFYCI